MGFERRDFLKIGSACVAVGLVNPTSAVVHASGGAVSGQLKGGTGTLHLEGRLKSGTLSLEIQDFVLGSDRTVIAHGVFDSVELYRALFIYNNESIVFAHLRDGKYSTTVILSDTDRSEIGQLVVWHDTEAADTFKVDKNKFMQSWNVRESILGGKGDSINLVGRRMPPKFTADELEAVFGDNPALLEFMRGKKSTHHPSPVHRLKAFVCEILRRWPGGEVWTLDWEAEGNETSHVPSGAGPLRGRG